MYSRLYVRLNNACFVGVHGMQVNGVFSTSYRILLMTHDSMYPLADKSYM